MAIVALIALVLAPSIQAMGSVSISEGPQNVTILRGGTVELRCVFMNVGTAQVMWFRSGGEMISNGNTILPNARPVEGSYQLGGIKRRGQYFLVITNVQLGDADEYSCAYTKDNGDMDSRSAFVIVQSPPSAGYPMCSVEPESPRVGDYATFTCVSEGGVPNANLAWYRNDVAKTPETLKRSSFRKVLKLDDMTARFYCKAASPVEDSPRRCDVQPVQIAPSVDMNPSELSGFVGEALFVTCLRVDKPSQTDFMWFYNDDAIDNLVDSSRFQILGNGDTLKIKRLVRRDDGATIKCQLQIYKGFMKHESATITAEISDLRDPSLSTISTLSSEVMRKEDVVTSYDSDIANVTYGLLTSSNESSHEEEQNTNATLSMILIIISICVVVSLALVLVFCKTSRSRKVTENSGSAREREDQRRNGNFRHVYETTFPVTPTENEAMLTGRDSQFDQATYQDHNAHMAGNQGTPHHRETSSHSELMRYQSDLVASPKNSKDKVSPMYQASDGVYDVPFPDGGASPSPSSLSSDGYIDIVKEKGQYDKFNHSPRVPNHHQLDKRTFPTPGKPMLRPVKSEANIADSFKTERGQLMTKHTSASNLSETDIVKPRQKMDPPKNRRITPNSPPPVQLVPRPNNFVLKQSPNSEHSHERQRESPSSSNVAINNSPNMLRPASGGDVEKPGQKINSPKNKRVTPNSPPPTHLVPRPKNFDLNQSPYSEYSHEIRGERLPSSNILNNKSPKLVRPMVALKPVIKTPPNQTTPVQKSPPTPQKHVKRNDGQTDKDGYEIPVNERTRLTKQNQKGSTTSYEYEQIDHVMTSPSSNKCLKKNNNRAPSGEYTSLDKLTVAHSNYQELSPKSECSPSSGKSMTLSSQHEYETPHFSEPKKQTIGKPVYLEILD